MTADAALTPSHTRPTWRIAISVEMLAYLILFMVALALRWIGLGAAPLGELEARQAIAAWHLLSPTTPGSGAISSVLTFIGAVISFALATPTEAAARFVPMLGGVALVFTPLLFRERLGRLPTLISVALLTLSPGAVAASRQVDGSGLAMLALVLVLAASDRYLDNQKPWPILLAGIALGLALLADYGALVALITLAGGVALTLLTDDEDHSAGASIRAALHDLPWSTLVAGLLGTLGVVGTLLFIAPGGLGAAADQLARFAVGIVHRPPGAPYLGLVILIYEPGILLFGLIGAWLAFHSEHPWQRFLSGWGIAALVISLIYPGALPTHSLWSIVPLAALAGLALTGLLNLRHNAPTWAPWGHAAGVIALLGMTFASFSHHLRAPRMLTIPPDNPLSMVVGSLPADLILACMWIILLMVLWLTVASLWGARSAWRGLGLGLAIPALLVSTGQSGALAFTRASSPYELLNQYPAQVTLTTMVDTAQQISELATGNPNTASITVQGDPNGALAWALRDFTTISYVRRATPDVQTIMVITPADGAEPALGSSYVGQGFVIVQQWGPGALDLAQFARWVLYRTAPESPPGDLRVILWVREDIYRLAPDENSAH